MGSETTGNPDCPPESWKMTRLSTTLGLLLLALTTPAQAQGSEPSYKTGKALEAALSARISWSSHGAELGDQVHDLQKQAEVIILRDRRIDPHQLASIEADSRPRTEILRQLTEAIPDGGFCVTEWFACIGTKETVHRLPLLIVRNRNLVNSQRKKLSAEQFLKLTSNINVHWEHLAEPRQILLTYANASGATIRNPEAVPHDIWTEGQLPGMSFPEMAAVILNQFDLTLSMTKGTVEFSIVPVDIQQSLQHRYSVDSKFKSSVIAGWQEKVPTAAVKWTGANALVTATLEQHVVLSSIVSDLMYSPSNAPTNSTSKGSLRTTRFQLSAERATIGELINYFRANNVSIEVKDEELPAMKAVFREIVRLDKTMEKQAGTEFFPRLFSKHFRTVTVLDDRVILSAE